MPHCCAASGCSTSNRKPVENKIHFFRFPLDPERCQKWLSNCRRDDLAHKSPTELNRTYRVCSLHFEKSQFTNCACDRLMHCAVPTAVDCPVQPQWLSAMGPDEGEGCCEMARLKGPHMKRTICLQMTLQKNDPQRKETDHCYSTTANGSIARSCHTSLNPTNDCCGGNVVTESEDDNCYYSEVKGEMDDLKNAVENAEDGGVVSEPSSVPLIRGGLVDMTSLGGTFRIRVTPAGHGQHEKSTQCCLTTSVPASSELAMHGAKQLLLKRKLRVAQCRISKLKRELRKEQECHRTRRRCLSMDDLLKAAEDHLNREQLIVLTAQMKANQKKKKRKRRKQQMLSAG